MKYTALRVMASHGQRWINRDDLALWLHKIDADPEARPIVEQVIETIVGVLTMPPVLPEGSADWLDLASRFTLDPNTVRPGGPGYDHTLVLHVERTPATAGDQWWIRRNGTGGTIYNLVSQNWDDERTARHADEHEHTTGQAEALRQATLLLRLSRRGPA